jgi:uncharacterized repeat protein (TIGR03803 family)
MQNHRLLFNTRSAAAILFITMTISMRAWSAEIVLDQFSGLSGANPGAHPYGALIADSEGNLYGTTLSGGSSNAGVVFEMVYSSASGSYSEKVLYSFTGAKDGGEPVAALVFDTSSNLYGTTSRGGLYGSGTAFELVSLGGGTYSPTPTVLHSFAGGTDGATPSATLIVDSLGNLYGTTEFGGEGSCSSAASGCGVVFELVKTSDYKETILYRFTGKSDGGLPLASLVFDSSKNIYGTTTCGGEANCAGASRGNGVVFEIVYSGGSYSSTLTVLHSFTGGSGGGVPVATVILDSSGNVYGTTEFGGGTGTLCSSSGCGVVFEIVKSGGSYNLLHSFAGTDGAQPTAGLALDGAGNLYGTTFAGGTSGAGVVFTLQVSGAGYGVLYSFTGGSDGGNPYAGVTLPENGPRRCPSNCGLGVTVNGGSGFGVAFQLSPL